MPVYAMDDDPDTNANNMELASVTDIECASAASTLPRQPTGILTDSSDDTVHADRPIHITVQPAAVHIPPQNDSALKAIADKIGGIRWQQSIKGFSSSLNTIGIICMLCSVGDKISNAISGQKLECTCTCPKCPAINFPMAPTPLIMRNDTTNSTSDWNNTLANGTTSYSNGTYSSNTATFMALIGNMTKQKTD